MKIILVFFGSIQVSLTVTPTIKSTMTTPQKFINVTVMFCCLLSAVAVSAQQPSKPYVHLVTLVWDDDTMDKYSIYPQCKENIAMVTQLFDAWSNKRVYDVKTSAGQIILFDTIKSISLHGDDDVIIFYYSGHGAVDAQYGHHFQCKTGAILRSKVREALEKKGAKLTVMLSDTCAVGQNAALAPWGGDKEKPLQIENMKLLFFHVGFADINSSSKGEYSWFDSHSGIFTSSFIHILKTSTAISGWHDFVEYTREETQRKYVEFRKNNLNNSRLRDKLINQNKQTVWAMELPTLPTLSPP